MLRQAPYERIHGLTDPEQGLSDADVTIRRDKYGVNDIIDSPVSGWRELLRDTLGDPMLWFLLITGSLFAIIGEFRETVILAIALVPLAGMDMYLHRRTRASTASLGGRLSTQANVIRNSRQVNIPSRDIVCGDLVLLGPNDFLPADGVILAAREAQVDESALTGEAFPARKRSYLPANEQNSRADDVAIDTEHWGFAGTRLLTGSMRLRVVFTAGETYYGEIVRSALHGRHAKTPLQIAIASVVTALLITAVVVCLVLAVVRWNQGFGLLDAVISAMTLAVAAMPEEFPVVFTFFLGIGVYRLAKQRALVRRAVAVENIGRVTTVCSDKTGTLTFGRLTLAHAYPSSPYDTAQLLETARHASRAESGDPMDLAIINAANNGSNNSRHLMVFPFTEDRKKETAVLIADNGQQFAVAKGAPETILSQCKLSGDERARHLETMGRLAGTGHKLIACARRVLDETDPKDREPQTEFEYVGLLALADPVREGVAEAIRFCRQTGIHVIMITGDHPLTARAVAQEIGLGNGEPHVLTADEVEAQTDLQKVDVIARSIPAQKLRFVRQLQENGEIVAVTGDGVNDVPALQAADVGIAMGERGTQAAREVSSIVLLDDNFRTIVRAIAEGTQLFHNLRISFAYLLFMHIPLVISAALIPLMGFPLLYLPVHIVWLELIIHPTALLAYQQLSDHTSVPVRKARTKTQFFTRGEWILISLTGLLLTAVVVCGFILNLGADRNIEHARAMALAVLCLGSAFMTMTLSQLSTMASSLVVAGTVLSTVLLIQTPMLADILHLQPLHLRDWMAAFLAGGLIALIPRLGRLGRHRKTPI